MAEQQKITLDKRNYRKHNDANKKIIRKSLEELGAGRSVLIDNEGSLIAGNGVYEQAKKLKIPVRVVETDGSELVVVKRTDLQTDDEKRKKLALADNAASDLSEWDEDPLRADWTKEALADWGVELSPIEDEDEKPDLSDSINPSYRVEVTCACEKEQEALFNQLTSEGYQCRILTL